MGWFQRMQRSRARKKRRKLEYNIKKSYGNPGKIAKYQRQLDALNAKFPPPGSKPSQPVHSEQPKTPYYAPAYRSAAVSTPSKPVTHTPQPAPARTNASAASKKAGPSIPEGNRFAAHEQLISRIARQAARACAKWIRNKGEWKPVNNGYSSQYEVEITVHKDCVDYNKLAYEHMHNIRFEDYGMADIHEAETEAFLNALKPYMDVYCPEEIEKAFSDVSPLIKRSTTVTFGKYCDSIDFDGVSHYKKSICVAMHYTNPPAPKLKSW